MSKQITHIAPWQAGKLAAVIYFFLSLIFVIPMVLISMLEPASAPGPRLGAKAIVLIPVAYAVAAIILVPLTCWIYNLAAKSIGGLKITLSDDTDSRPTGGHTG